MLTPSATDTTDTADTADTTDMATRSSTRSSGSSTRSGNKPECPDICMLLLPSLHAAMKEDQFEPFLKLDERWTDMDYHVYVASPMDMHTLCERLKQDVYGGAACQLFFRDALLIAENCEKFFHASGSDFYHQQWKDDLKPVLKSWRERVGHMTSLWDLALEIFETQRNVFCTTASTLAPAPVLTSSSLSSAAGGMKGHHVMPSTANGYWISRPREKAFKDLTVRVETGFDEGISPKCGRFDSPFVKNLELWHKPIAKEVYRSDTHVYLEVQMENFRNHSSFCSGPGQDFRQPYFIATLFDGSTCSIQSGLDFSGFGSDRGLCFVELSDLYLDAAHTVLNICASAKSMTIAQVTAWMKIHKPCTLMLPLQIETVSDSNNTRRIASHACPTGEASRRRGLAIESLRVTQMPPAVLPSFFAAKNGHADDLRTLLSAKYVIRDYIMLDLIRHSIHFRHLCDTKKGNLPFGNWQWNPEDLTSLPPFDKAYLPYVDVLYVLLTFFNGVLPGCEQRMHNSPLGDVAKRWRAARLACQRPALGRIVTPPDGVKITACVAKKIADRVNAGSRERYMYSLPASVADVFKLEARAAAAQRMLPSGTNVAADAAASTTTTTTAAAPPAAAPPATAPPATAPPTAAPPAAAPPAVAPPAVAAVVASATPSGRVKPTFLTDFATAKLECDRKLGTVVSIGSARGLIYNRPPAGLRAHSLPASALFVSRWVVPGTCNGGQLQRNVLMHFYDLAFPVINGVLQIRNYRNDTPTPLMMLPLLRRIWNDVWQTLKSLAPQPQLLAEEANGTSTVDFMLSRPLEYWLLPSEAIFWLSASAPVPTSASTTAATSASTTTSTVVASGSKRPRVEETNGTDADDDDGECCITGETTWEERDAKLRAEAIDLCSEWEDGEGPSIN